MPSLLINTLLDGMGMTRAIVYRTFVQRKWSPPQPMFNIVTVKPGKEGKFETFLRKSLDISIKINTPISLGPYKSAETRTYVYVTHYGSTIDFMRVMLALTFSGVTLLRDACIQKTSWVYCNPTNAPADQMPENLLMIGVKGSRSQVFNYLNKQGIYPIASVDRIKNVRGQALGHYLFYPDLPEVHQQLEVLIQQGADINILKMSKLNH